MEYFACNIVNFNRQRQKAAADDVKRCRGICFDDCEPCRHRRSILTCASHINGHSVTPASLLGAVRIVSKGDSMKRWAWLLFIPVLAACGGGGGDSGESPNALAADSGDFTSAQLAKLKGYVQEDMEKHGQAIGCVTLISVHGEATTATPLELTGSTGKPGVDWGVGTIGNLDSKAETQFATLYAVTPPTPKHTKLTETSGDGFACYESSP